MYLNELSKIETEMLLKAPGTMYEGFGLHGRPEQGPSPVPYKSLAELARSFVNFASENSARSACARTEFSDAKLSGLLFGESHQWRCSTADESQIRDFAPSERTR